MYAAFGDAQSNRFGIELAGFRQGVQLPCRQRDEPATQVFGLVESITQRISTPPSLLPCA